MGQYIRLPLLPSEDKNAAKLAVVNIPFIASVIELPDGRGCVVCTGNGQSFATTLSLEEILGKVAPYEDL